MSVEILEPQTAEQIALVKCVAFLQVAVNCGILTPEMELRFTGSRANLGAVTLADLIDEALAVLSEEA